MNPNKTSYEFGALPLSYGFIYIIYNIYNIKGVDPGVHSWTLGNLLINLEAHRRSRWAINKMSQRNKIPLSYFPNSIRAGFIFKIAIIGFEPIAKEHESYVLANYTILHYIINLNLNWI